VRTTQHRPAVTEQPGEREQADGECEHDRRETSTRAVPLDDLGQAEFVPAAGTLTGQRFPRSQ
jgi:hypothetical protein